MFRNLKWVTLLAVFALGTAACSDDGSTGPPQGTPFNPQSADQATANLQSQLNTDSDIMISLGLASDGMSQAGAVSMVLPRDLDRAVTPMSAQVLRSYTLAGSSAEPIFPSNLLGKTFEWSFALGRYEMSARTGAPTNGVRFILYAIDPLTRQPADPLNEIGLLDLTDEGDAAATRVGIYAESGGEALVDYFIAASYALLGQQDYSVTLHAEGYVSDATERLDFALDQTATFLGTSATVGMDISYWLSLAGEDVSVNLDLSGEFTFASESPVETATAQLTIRNGTEVVVLDVSLAADNTLDGVITYNGTPAINISGTEADPVFTRADGEVLTEADLTALRDLYELLGDVFDVAMDLFQPFGGMGL